MMAMSAGTTLRRALGGMRRYAWAGVALWLTVAISSAIGYARTPAVFIATTSLQVTLAPIGLQTAADQQQLDAQAVALARMIASPAFLTSPQFITAVSQQLNNGDPAHELSSELIREALSGSHTDARVTFTAQANSTTQATRLAQATTQTLMQHATDLLSTPSNSTIRLVPDQQAPTVAPDTIASDTARGILLARLGLATATALLLTFALGWLTSRPTSRSATEKATSPEHEATAGM